MKLTCGRHTLDLSRPRIMGVVNITPDSFSDGGRYFDASRAIDHARSLIADGADILDVGGESTRPDAEPVPEDEELERVLPIVERMASEGAIVSIDTMKPAVMRAAIAAGASMVNDVRALQEPGAMEAAAANEVAVCLMHMQGAPRTMQHAPSYDDVVREVGDFLLARAQECEEAGISRERIVIDPGFGFGKTMEHNLELLRGLPEIAELGYPVLVGLSRKATIGKLTGRGIGERMAGSIAAALSAIVRGASIVRVHDVRETADALKVWLAIAGKEGA